MPMPWEVQQTRVNNQIVQQQFNPNQSRWVTIGHLMPTGQWIGTGPVPGHPIPNQACINAFNITEPGHTFTFPKPAPKPS